MFSMKMFRNLERTLRHELDKDFSHRKDDVRKNISTGNDSIYNCNIYKEWCYEKLLELIMAGHILPILFSKTNIVAGGYAFYDCPYWLKLGMKEVWIFQTKETFV